MKRFGRIIAVTALILTMAISMSSCATTMGLVLLGNAIENGEISLGFLDDWFSNGSDVSEGLYVYDTCYRGKPVFVLGGIGSCTDSDIVFSGYWTDAQGNDISVSIIEADAFYGNTEIRSFKVLDSVELIGDNAFYDCYNLRSVDLGPTVTKIGNKAFAYCALEEVTLPESLTKIESFAFLGNSNLKEIRLSSSLKYLDYTAFEGCDVVVNFGGSPSEWRQLAENSNWSSDMPCGVTAVTYTYSAATYSYSGIEE